MPGCLVAGDVCTCTQVMSLLIIFAHAEGVHTFFPCCIFKGLKTGVFSISWSIFQVNATKSGKVCSSVSSLIGAGYKHERELALVLLDHEC